MAKIKAIFIDWNGTLSISRFWEQFEEESHPLHDYYLKIQENLFESPAPLSHLIDNWMRGEYTAEEIVGMLAPKIGLKSDELLDELIISCENMKLISPQVPDLVNQLKSKGLKVAIASDNMDTFTRFTCPALKLNTIFDEVLCSYDRKALKHDADPSGKSLFFGEFLEENGLAPEQIILVDDSRTFLGAIEGFGIKVDLIESATGLIPKLHEIIKSLD